MDVISAFQKAFPFETLVENGLNTCGPLLSNILQVWLGLPVGEAAIFWLHKTWQNICQALCPNLD